MKNESYKLKLAQVARHLMMVECLLFPWKQLPVLVLKLDFAVFAAADSLCLASVKPMDF